MTLINQSSGKAQHVHGHSAPLMLSSSTTVKCLTVPNKSSAMETMWKHHILVLNIIIIIRFLKMNPGSLSGWSTYNLKLLHKKNSVLSNNLPLPLTPSKKRSLNWFCNFQEAISVTISQMRMNLLFLLRTNLVVCIKRKKSTLSAPKCKLKPSL